MAFILLNLPGITNLDHVDRTGEADAVADLLWFPTGGGKTEAYLGLSAYTMALRRLQGTIAGRSGDYGVAVLMRYTLRLLTIQQFQRATTLICACEILPVLPTGLRETRFSMAYSHPYKEPDDMEAIMKIDTPLHTDHQLDQLAGQFEHWRRTRSHPSERIPQRLWKQAAALARVLPYSRVAQHVRVSPSDLKKPWPRRAPRSRPSPRPHDLSKCRLRPPGSPATQVMEIELERPDGARLRLRCPESTSPVAALVRAFLEVAR